MKRDSSSFLVNTHMPAFAAMQSIVSISRIDIYTKKPQKLMLSSVSLDNLHHKQLFFSPWQEQSFHLLKKPDLINIFR